MAEEERIERLANRVGRLERALEAIADELDRRSATERGRGELAHGGPLPWLIAHEPLTEEEATAIYLAELKHPGRDMR